MKDDLAGTRESIPHAEPRLRKAARAFLDVASETYVVGDARWPTRYDTARSALRAALDATDAQGVVTCPECNQEGLAPRVCEVCGHRWYA